jgi:hypothetical protein
MSPAKKRITTNNAHRGFLLNIPSGAKSREIFGFGISFNQATTGHGSAQLAETPG